jgi:hypothetical protein
MPQRTNKMIKAVTDKTSPDWFVLWSKGKAIRVTGRGGPWSCETSRLPHLLDSRLRDGGEVSSLTHWPPFTRQKDSWHSFHLQAESTPGPQCGWKDWVNWINPVTSSVIEPATFRLVASCHNQLCYRVPPHSVMGLLKWIAQSCADDDMAESMIAVAKSRTNRKKIGSWWYKTSVTRFYRHRIVIEST